MTQINDAPGRYELWEDGKVVGESVYRDAGNRRVFLHTEVDADYAGRGLATQLITWALNDVRAKGKRFVAICPLVAAYVQKHHEFDDILDTVAGVDGP
jgi:predicted GNAT family acetyltransferase